jgi:predicted CxxxxCH...CXXCH cytochrome family protein
VEVELANALAPEGSIKAKNPADATYDPDAQTCSNVYCHSGYTVTSGVVGMPLTFPANPVPPGFTVNNSYIMDETCSALTYAPYAVSYARVYAATPPWGTVGTFTTCAECHAFPLTTYYPTVYAGVADSHQWVDEVGWNWGHAFNMGFGGIPCRTCHSSTVSQAGTVYWTTGENGADIMAYDPVPLASHVTHVNGIADVAFDAVNGFLYRNTYSLVGATYDPSTKTCSDVTCHYNPNGPLALWQKRVTWGSPWRYYTAECDLCHRYGYLNETCQPGP